MLSTGLQIPTMGMFIQDFTTMIEESIMGKHELITIGDFNIHMENKLNVDTVLFDDILEAFNLINNVNFPTHIVNHTLGHQSTGFKNNTKH